MSFFLDFLRRHVSLVIMAAFLHRHLGRKVPGSNRIDADGRRLKLGTHHLGQVDCGALGRVVSEMTLGLPHDATHAGNHDDGRRTRGKRA